MVFPVVVYRCKSWTIKKAECWRTDAFELWCWRRLLRVSWMAKRSNQSILREINPALKGLLLEAKAPILWLLNGNSRLIGKDPDAGKDWGQKEKRAIEDESVRWHHRLNGHVAAAAKSLQSCLTLCDAIDSSPPGSPIPGILQARTLEWVAISFSNVWKWKVKVKLLSCVRLFETPWTAAHQAPPSTGFSRQEYWSGVPLP